MMALEAPPTSFDLLRPRLLQRVQSLVIRSVAVGRSSTTSSTRAIELCEEGSSNLLDYPRLLWGEVLPPPTRGGLAVELPIPFVLLGDLLPGVLLHHPRQLPFVYKNPQRRVDPLHGL